MKNNPIGMLPKIIPPQFTAMSWEETKDPSLGMSAKPTACFVMADEKTSVVVTHLSHSNNFRIRAYDDKKKLFEFCVSGTDLLEKIIEAIKAEQVQDEFNNQASSNLQMNVGSESP